MADVGSIVRELKALALTVARLQFELDGHLKDVEKPLADFYKFVMDPQDGLVVKLRHLERNVEQDRQATAFVVNGTRKVPGLESRIIVLEDAAKKREEGHEWGRRNILWVGLMLLVTAVAGAWIGAKLGAGP